MHELGQQHETGRVTDRGRGGRRSRSGGEDEFGREADDCDGRRRSAAQAGDDGRDCQPGRRGSAAGVAVRGDEWVAGEDGDQQERGGAEAQP
jgi:hypothetical protein